MLSFLMSLKNVVMVILVGECCKELLSGDSFQPYVQFAVRVFLFCFLLSALFHTDFSWPEWTDDALTFHAENNLLATYETQISRQTEKYLNEHGITDAAVTVDLSESYEIERIKIATDAPAQNVAAVLKGEFPYEVVPKALSDTEST